MAPSFADEIDYSNFFDQIDDLLDFPDEVCNSLKESSHLSGDFMDFPSTWTQLETFPGSESVFSEDISNSKPAISTELSVPYEDIVQMEWLSTFVEDSFSPENNLTVDVVNNVPNAALSTNQFQTSSPVSVLESSGSCYAGGKVLPVKPSAVPKGTRCGRARSKRPRPPTFNPRASMQLVSPSASFTLAGQPFGGLNSGLSECESFGDSHSSKVRKSAFCNEQKKKKKVKLSAPVAVDQNENRNPLSPEGEVRKCQHCEITKTPQWRAGPMGPKTLCNACGVRYKSGRLFPEYRPAASPTFVPTIHSNSHKKVLEMRVRTYDRTVSPLIEGSSSDSTLIELLPNNNNPMVDYI